MIRIGQEIANLGATIVVVDIQKDFIHFSDPIFKKDKSRFIPIDETKIKTVSIKESRKFLSETGITGELIHTPGHSDDSISLWLDEGSLFVGDLNPLYELEAYKGTQIAETWEKLLKLNPKRVYYGHAKKLEKNKTEE